MWCWRGSACILVEGLLQSVQESGWCAVGQPEKHMRFKTPAIVAIVANGMPTEDPVSMKPSTAGEESMRRELDEKDVALNFASVVHPHIQSFIRIFIACSDLVQAGFAPPGPVV